MGEEQIAFEPGITQDRKRCQLVFRGAGLTIEIVADTATHPYSEAEYPVCPKAIRHAIEMLTKIASPTEVRAAPSGESYPIRPLPRGAPQ